MKLGIASCWKPRDVEWQNVGHLMAQWKYRCALNNLESLVVAHIFELGKMNRAGTGELLITELLHDNNQHSFRVQAMQAYRQGISGMVISNQDHIGTI